MRNDGRFRPALAEITSAVIRDGPKPSSAGHATRSRHNAPSDERLDSLRISIDTKAILKLGELSRGGSARSREAVKAQDKDLDVKGKLVPFGILEVLTGVVTIIFGTSRETSDFLVDCLEQWWQDRKAFFGHIRELVINLDNRPELASGRTQFIQRMIGFSDRHQLEIHVELDVSDRGIRSAV